MNTSKLPKVTALNTGQIIKCVLQLWFRAGSVGGQACLVFESCQYQCKRQDIAIFTPTRNELGGNRYKTDWKAKRGAWDGERMTEGTVGSDSPRQT
eukprot:5015060-Pyramimonas_sp.AAC.3